MKPDTLLDSLDGLSPDYISEAKPHTLRTPSRAAASGEAAPPAAAEMIGDDNIVDLSGRRHGEKEYRMKQNIFHRVTTGAVAAAACAVFACGGWFIAKQAKEMRTADNSMYENTEPGITNFLGGSGTVSPLNEGNAGCVYLRDSSRYYTPTRFWDITGGDGRFHSVCTKPGCTHILYDPEATDFDCLAWQTAQRRICSDGEHIFGFRINEPNTAYLLDSSGNESLFFDVQQLYDYTTGETVDAQQGQAQVYRISKIWSDGDREHYVIQGYVDNMTTGYFEFWIFAEMTKQEDGSYICTDSYFAPEAFMQEVAKPDDGREVRVSAPQIVPDHHGAEHGFYVGTLNGGVIFEEVYLDGSAAYDLPRETAPGSVIYLPAEDVQSGQWVVDAASDTVTYLHADGALHKAAYDLDECLRPAGGEGVQYNNAQTTADGLVSEEVNYSEADALMSIQDVPALNSIIAFTADGTRILLLNEDLQAQTVYTVDANSPWVSGDAPADTELFQMFFPGFEMGTVCGDMYFMQLPFNAADNEQFMEIDLSAGSVRYISEAGDEDDDIAPQDDYDEIQVVHTNIFGGIGELHALHDSYGCLFADDTRIYAACGGAYYDRSAFTAQNHFTKYYNYSLSRGGERIPSVYGFGANTTQFFMELCKDGKIMMIDSFGNESVFAELPLKPNGAVWGSDGSVWHPTCVKAKDRTYTVFAFSGYDEATNTLESCLLWYDENRQLVCKQEEAVSNIDNWEGTAARAVLGGTNEDKLFTFELLTPPDENGEGARWAEVLPDGDKVWNQHYAIRERNVYYLNQNHDLCRFDLDNPGGEKEILMHDADIYSFDLIDDTLYYVSADCSTVTCWNLNDDRKQTIAAGKLLTDAGFTVHKLVRVLTKNGSQLILCAPNEDLNVWGDTVMIEYDLDTQYVGFAASKLPDGAETITEENAETNIFGGKGELHPLPTRGHYKDNDRLYFTYLYGYIDYSEPVSGHVQPLHHMENSELLLNPETKIINDGEKMYRVKCKNGRIIQVNSYGREAVFADVPMPVTAGGGQITEMELNDAFRYRDGRTYKVYKLFNATGFTANQEEDAHFWLWYDEAGNLLSCVEHDGRYGFDYRYGPYVVEHQDGSRLLMLTPPDENDNAESWVEAMPGEVIQNDLYAVRDSSVYYVNGNDELCQYDLVRDDEYRQCVLAEGAGFSSLSVFDGEIYGLDKDHITLTRTKRSGFPGLNDQTVDTAKLLKEAGYDGYEVFTVAYASDGNIIAYCRSAGEGTPDKEFTQLYLLYDFDHKTASFVEA